MNEKINWADLRKAVVNRSNAPEKDVTMFLNALTQAVKEGLKEDGTVRVNGLGTFSVKAVAERKSVDVNTGKEIVIPGYNKVSFAPEAAMKDITDHISPTPSTESQPQPTAVSEKVDEAEDPMKKIGEQATEILGILAELHEMDKDLPTEPEPVEQEPVEPEETPEEPVKPEETETLEITEEAEDTVDPEEPTEKEEEEPEETPEEPVEPTEDELGDTTRPWLIASLCILVLAIVTSVLFLTRGPQIRRWLDRTKSEKVAEPIEVATPKEEIVPVNQVVEEVEAAEEVVQPSGLPKREYTEWKDTVQMNPGSRLTLLAQRHYGSKDLWVFIYEANQDRLPSPNRINIGESIYIPELAPEWCDLSNEQVVATIDSLKTIYKQM